ncbi:hypothetical protein SCLCIDRAFT_32359 [Scleroderma citrinum Foug A]|uniref:Uncharacterized protein n=1 Tax=Scleroderma citrinum Foug A TaxID=1036808 RepID=A0A0C3D8V8_9AGAM|nr:hypothetical protein SCLCIDRAFT_32359 [Scleroderma citrinum Foug A]
MVDCCAGDGPAEGNQLDPGERDVPVFGGGDPAILKVFEEMVCKDFISPGPSSNLYPSTNEEVDSTALHYTICHPLWHHPVTVKQATSVFLPTFSAIIQFTLRTPSPV